MQPAVPSECEAVLMMQMAVYTFINLKKDPWLQIKDSIEAFVPPL